MNILYKAKVVSAPLPPHPLFHLLSFQLLIILRLTEPEKSTCNMLQLRAVANVKDFFFPGTEKASPAAEQRGSLKTLFFLIGVFTLQIHQSLF